MIEHATRREMENTRYLYQDLLRMARMVDVMYENYEEKMAKATFGGSAGVSQCGNLTTHIHHTIKTTQKLLHVKTICLQNVDRTPIYTITTKCVKCLMVITKLPTILNECVISKKLKPTFVFGQARFGTIDLRPPNLSAHQLSTSWSFYLSAKFSLYKPWTFFIHW